MVLNPVNYKFINKRIEELLEKPLNSFQFLKLSAFHDLLMDFKNPFKTENKSWLFFDDNHFFIFYIDKIFNKLSHKQRSQYLINICNYIEENQLSKSIVNVTLDCLWDKKINIVVNDDEKHKLLCFFKTISEVEKFCLLINDIKTFELIKTIHDFTNTTDFQNVLKQYFQSLENTLLINNNELNLSI